MCAPLGGAIEDVNYIANVRVLFDAMYPGVIPGDVLHVPAGIDLNTQVLGPAQYLDRYYVPDGELDAPTLTMHTTRDPLVPFFHEASFARLVSDEHDSGQLLQRSFNRYGHCAFTTAEMVDGFEALAQWAKTGIKPGS